MLQSLSQVVSVVVKCQIIFCYKQLKFTLLLKTNKTGCVYFVCFLHIVDMHAVK